MEERFFIVWEEKDEFLEITEEVYRGALVEKMPVNEVAKWVMEIMDADRYENFPKDTSSKVIVDWVMQDIVATQFNKTTEA